jgi:NADH-quinone oxidoreductase subunit A
LVEYAIDGPTLEDSIADDLADYVRPAARPRRPGLRDKPAATSRRLPIIRRFDVGGIRKLGSVPLLLGIGDSLHQDYTTILVFLVFGALFVILNMVAIGRLIRSKTKYTEAKATSYECGEPTFGSAFIRFDIRFYVVALVFVIFDVEVLFLFPWAVVLKELGWWAFGEAALFIVVVALGLAYVWRKGDLDWIPQHGHKAPGTRQAGLRPPGPSISPTTVRQEKVPAGAEPR